MYRYGKYSMTAFKLLPKKTELVFSKLLQLLCLPKNPRKMPRNTRSKENMDQLIKKIA
jgi:hypothetical protein